MKLHRDRSVGQNIVTAYDERYIEINGMRHSTSLLVLPQRLETDWRQVTFDGLQLADFERLAQLGCEVLLLGTGSRQQFPPAALLQPLMAARIGFEIMDSGAACRTYNIVMAEGRNVAALLLFDQHAD
jgi:uncharacterized protein